MLNRKGQGLTEYGIILLLVVLLGSVVWFGSDINAKDQSMYSSISQKLQSIIDDVSNKVAKTFDTNNVVHQKTRATPSYATTLTKISIGGKLYDVLWRYENMKKVNGNFVLDPDITTKVYYLALHDASADYQVYSGTNGLMTNAFAAGKFSNKDGSATEGTKDYSSYGGYVSGSDDNGTYKATYFNLNNTTYEIKDYGANGGYANTILSEYTGNTSATVTNAATGKSDTIANMAATRTDFIDTTGVSVIKPQK
jgi:hypothetical protein